MCTKNLKSGYHYLTAFLKHATALKNLEIIGPTYTKNPVLPFKAVKCIFKGF